MRLPTGTGRLSLGAFARKSGDDWLAGGRGSLSWHPYRNVYASLDAELGVSQTQALYSEVYGVFGITW